MDTEQAATTIQAWYRRWRIRNVYVTVLDLLEAEPDTDVAEEIFGMGAFSTTWYDGTGEVDWFHGWRLRYHDRPYYLCP